MLHNVVHLHQWYEEFFDLVKDGPGERPLPEWEAIDASITSGTWVDRQLKLLQQTAGPSRAIIIATISRILILKTTVIYLRKNVIAIVTEIILPDLATWKLSLAEYDFSGADGDPDGLDEWAKEKFSEIKQKCGTMWAKGHSGSCS